jgi:hypothetical protein
MLVAGWDWANTSHAVTILDPTGRIVDRWILDHTEPDLAAALTRLASHAAPATLPVAIEATRGLVVDRLLAAGHPVIPVHATAFHAARPRWSAAGAKTDPGDSYKLADYLRTDGHRLRRLQPPDPATRELQALVRLRADHLAAKTTASNSCGRCLGRTGPALAPSGFGWHPRSRWTSSPPIPLPRAPPTSPRPTWQGSAASTPTGVARPLRCCWPSSKRPQRRRSGWRRPC